MADEELDGLEAEFEEPFDVVLGAVGEHGVGGVAEDLVLDRAAQQFIDGKAEQLSLEVPEGVVDGADGVACEAVGAVGGGRAAHEVPVLLDGHRVLALEEGREVVVDDGEDGAAHWGESDAPGSVFGGDDAGGAAPGFAPVPAREFVFVAGHWAGEVSGAGYGGDARLGLDGRRQGDGGGSDFFDLQFVPPEQLLVVSG